MASNKPLISVEGLAKSFADPKSREPVTVFQDIWLSVSRGEFVCIVGHSGCGKSTILNILAGLDRPSGGVVVVNGNEISGPSLDRAVIFQGHVLMPWKSALGNVELAVRSRHRDWPRAKVREHSLKYLSLVHLEDAADKLPAQLSGGMKQRVSIARALAIEPQILLMDEPFSALDALTRGSLQDELLAIVEATAQTTFMITHDIDEALLLADRILLMTNGPDARIAEVVENTLPRDRQRSSIHKHPHYYPLRNHLMDFLVSRSRELATPEGRTGIDFRSPPVARPGAAGPAAAPQEGEAASQPQRQAARA
ncbi:MAG TPA: ABC transporter ATP-binding protein [Afifellaceae bacterium]|nr:ABC transporter ATP-binding protein [Afifellaceae bacterium]